MPILTAAGTKAYTAYAERREALGDASDAARDAYRAARKATAGLAADARYAIIHPLHEAMEAATTALVANDDAFEAEGAAAEAAGVAWFTPDDDG